MNAVIKWSSLQKSVSIFMQKGFMRLTPGASTIKLFTAVIIAVS